MDGGLSYLFARLLMLISCHVCSCYISQSSTPQIGTLLPSTTQSRTDACARLHFASLLSFVSHTRMVSSRVVSAVHVSHHSPTVSSLIPHSCHCYHPIILPHPSLILSHLSISSSFSPLPFQAAGLAASLFLSILRLLSSSIFLSSYLLFPSLHHLSLFRPCRSVVVPDTRWSQHWELL